jgi:hypothetical protein
MKCIFSMISAICILILVSCNTIFEPTNPQITYGYWIYSNNIDSVHVYYFAGNFEKDKPGIAFKKDHVFIEQTSGWCATPPLSFFNIVGKWKQIDENQIEIFSKNWNNEDYSRIMKIISLTAYELRVFFYH